MSSQCDATLSVDPDLGGAVPGPGYNCTESKHSSAVGTISRRAWPGNLNVSLKSYITILLSNKETGNILSMSLQLVKGILYVW